MRYYHGDTPQPCDCPTCRTFRPRSHQISTAIGLRGEVTHTYRVPIFNGRDAFARFSFNPPNPQVCEQDKQGQLWRIVRVRELSMMRIVPVHNTLSGDVVKRKGTRSI